MNFPTTQRTGTLAELDVARLFVSWGWNVGRDQVDVGYDLFVMPTHSHYSGGRFLVQIKGTAKKTGRGPVRAPVSKVRLRQYAECTIPVFIVRATPEGKFYWLHAQPWSRLNEERLLGKGNITVELDCNQSLDNRADFEQYLRLVLSPKALMDQEQSQFPESLHSRSAIDAQRFNNSPLEADLPDSLTSQLTFTPVRTQENLEKFKDSLCFGLPRTFEVEEFNISCPPLLHSSLEGFGKGHVTLEPIDSKPGVIRLIPGSKRSITTTELVIDTEIFSGYQGSAVTNERKTSLLDICARFKVNENNSFSPSVKFSFRMSAISRRPIKDADYLSQIYLWAEQALKRRNFTLELESSGHRLPMPFPNDFQDSIVEFLHLAHTLGKIHLIARTTESAICIPSEFSISREELSDINIAYSLLRGDQHHLSSVSMELDPSEKFSPTGKVSLFGMRMLTFTLFNQEFCKIPARFDLIDHQIENIPNSEKMLITPGECGKAWISFAEDYSEDMEGAWFSSETPGLECRQS